MNRTTNKQFGLRLTYCFAPLGLTQKSNRQMSKLRNERQKQKNLSPQAHKNKASNRLGHIMLIEDLRIMQPFNVEWLSLRQIKHTYKALFCLIKSNFCLTSPTSKRCKGAITSATSKKSCQMLRVRLLV